MARQAAFASRARAFFSQLSSSIFQWQIFKIRYSFEETLNLFCSLFSSIRALTPNFLLYFCPLRPQWECRMAGAPFPFNWTISAPFSSALFPFSAEKRWRQQMLFGRGISRVHYINCWVEYCGKGKRSCIHTTSCLPQHVTAGTVNSAPFKKPWWDFPVAEVNLPWKTVMLFPQRSHLFCIQSRSGW